MKQGLYFLHPPPPKKKKKQNKKRTPDINTHQYEQGTLYTLTNNSNINPAS